MGGAGPAKFISWPRPPRPLDRDKKTATEGRTVRSETARHESGRPPPPPVKRQNEVEEGVAGTCEVHKRVPATVQHDERKRCRRERESFGSPSALQVPQTRGTSMESARAGREVHKRIAARAAQITEWAIEGWRERVPSLAPLPPKRPPSYKSGREVSGKGDRPAKFIAGWSSPRGGITAGGQSHPRRRARVNGARYKGGYPLRGAHLTLGCAPPLGRPTTSSLPTFPPERRERSGVFSRGSRAGRRGGEKRRSYPGALPSYTSRRGGHRQPHRRSPRGGGRVD